MRVRAMSVSPLVVRQGATAVTGFQPTDLSGLVAWYDASRITGLADGAAVAQWDDLSGNGNHLTQSTAGFRPIYKVNIINGLPVVRFDAVDDALVQTFDLVAPYTIFVVERSTAAGAGARRTVSSSVQNNLISVSARDAANNAFVEGNVSSFRASLDVPHVAVLLVNTGGSAYWVDGIDRTDTPATTGPWSNFGLGAVGGFGEPVGADVCEVAAYSTLSDGHRLALQSYAEQKWGVLV